MGLLAFAVLMFGSVIVMIITVAHLDDIQYYPEPKRRHREENVGIVIILVSFFLMIIGTIGTLWQAFLTLFVR